MVEEDAAIEMGEGDFLSALVLYAEYLWLLLLLQLLPLRRGL